MRIKNILLSTVIAAALSTGLCGCGSNNTETANDTARQNSEMNSQGAAFWDGIDGTGIGNSGFYGDYTYGANDTAERGSGITGSMDNRNSNRLESRRNAFYDSNGDLLYSDTRGGIIEADANNLGSE